MSAGWAIRPEEPGDERPIHDLVERAFAPMPYSDGSEQDLVDVLRRRGELALSLVAVSADGTIIGHIGFSPATIDQADCGWFQMAPVSVDPSVQFQGIGSALIGAGIDRLRGNGARGVAVVGNPAYYERFGFAELAELAPLHEHDAPFFRAMVLAGEAPSGTLRYASAFG
jgi:putative acetyltransferase